MGSYRVVLLPGDGIGPEVMDATVKVMDHVVQKLPKLHVQFSSHEAGANLYRQTGQALPDHVLEDCLAADAVLL
ncbi:MAG: isocitrate/isopropylmalate family dehydrogenase, partial [Planctomycetes bacterium]|nr:isocitrate/isopropylmalate family dehydrogenase [Planctomycetota bacterium]